MKKNTAFASFITLLLTLALAPAHTHPPSHSPKLHTQPTSNTLATQGEDRQTISFGTFKNAPITCSLVAITLLCSVLVYCFESTLKQHFTLSSNRWYTYITSMFYEQHPLVLFINNLILWTLGSHVEIVYRQRCGNTLGGSLYLCLYLLGGISTRLLLKDNHFKAIGGMAAIGTVLASWIVLNPKETIVYIPGPFLFPIFFIFTLITGHINKTPPINAVYTFVPELLGILVTIIIYTQLRRDKTKSTNPKSRLSQNVHRQASFKKEPKT